MTRSSLIPAAAGLAALLGVACTSPSQNAADGMAVPAPVEASADAPAGEGERSLAPFTLMVTGDNRGEVAPCGCKDNQTGGLPRRAQLVAKTREAGPVVLLDAGDALFEDPYRRNPRDADKAGLILDAMGEMGTAAMAVGDRDLAQGTAWLVDRAKAAGVPLLGANLATTAGERPFGARRLVQAGDAKVGVFGVYGLLAGAKPPAELVVEDPVAAATSQVEALQKEGADLVVALVHGPGETVRQIAQLPGIDLVVPSHDGSLSFPYQPAQGASWIFGAGQMGRPLTKIVLHLDGKGALVDAGAADRFREDRRHVEARLDETRTRLGTTRPGTPERQSLTDMVTQLEARAADLDRKVAQAGQAAGRRFDSEQVELGPNIGDEPAMAASVDAFLKANPWALPTR